MLDSIKARMGRDEEQGFTLIELMVVVLIIAILLAIAIPTFLGARDSANARSAQSNLRNADTAEQTYWTNNQSWDVPPLDTSSQGVTQAETALKWFADPTTVTPGPNINVAADTANNGVVLTAAGKDNHCYSVEVIDQPVAGAMVAGTYYYESTLQTAPIACKSPGGITGATAPTGSAAKNLGTWESSW